MDMGAKSLPRTSNEAAGGTKVTGSGQPVLLHAEGVQQLIAAAQTSTSPPHSEDNNNQEAGWWQSPNIPAWARLPSSH